MAKEAETSVTYLRGLDDPVMGPKLKKTFRRNGIKAALNLAGLGVSEGVAIWLANQPDGAIPAGLTILIGGGITMYFGLMALEKRRLALKKLSEPQKP